MPQGKKHKSYRQKTLACADGSLPKWGDEVPVDRLPHLDKTRPETFDASFTRRSHNPDKLASSQKPVKLVKSSRAGKR